MQTRIDHEGRRARRPALYIGGMSARPLAIVPFLLLVVPIAEIAAFIAVGQQIGIGWTLLLILVTAVIGTLLLRAQGLGLLARAQGEIAAGRVPARELVHGVMLLVAGVLLLTPGFITDALGFLLFVPPLRDWGWRHLRSRLSLRTVMGGAMGGMGAGRMRRGPDPRRGGDGTIDLGEEDYRRTDAGAGPDAEPDRHQTIYKIADAQAWGEAERTGVFQGAPVDRADGFIHFSTAEQVRATAAKHFAGRGDLVVAAVSGAALDRMGNLFHYEPSRGGDLFPHLYGPLPMEAVEWSEPLPWDEARGEHRFPRGL